MLRLPPSGIASSAFRMMLMNTWDICPSSIMVLGRSGSKETRISIVFFIRLSRRMRSSVDCRTSLSCTCLYVERICPRKGGHLPHDIGDPLDVFIDDVEAVLRELIRGHFPEQLGERRDRGEGIADLVGDAGGKPAERGQFLGMHDLLLEFLCRGGPLVDLVLQLDRVLLERILELDAFGNVSARDQDARGLAVDEERADVHCQIQRGLTQSGEPVVLDLESCCPSSVLCRMASIGIPSYGVSLSGNSSKNCLAEKVLLGPAERLSPARYSTF